MTDLQPLIDRLEEVEGPDRELDLDIWFLLVEPRHLWTKDHRGNWFVNRGGTALNPVWEDSNPFMHAPEYTVSVDAAIGLAERVLPGWVWNVGGCQPDFLTDKDKPLGADLMGPVEWVPDREIGEEPVFDNYSASASTAPIAICLAVLRALQSRKGTDHEGE